MKTLKTIAAAALIASSLALAPAGAHAQTAAPAVSGFDAYRVVAVTAGVVVGAAAAVVVTDGLIIPVYAYATGAGGGMAAGTGMAAGLGHWGAAGTAAIRGGMRVLGAVAGGFYADSWYTGR